MSRNYNRALAYHTKIVERNQKKEGKLRDTAPNKSRADSQKPLDEYWIGNNFLIRNTNGSAHFVIRDRSFKLRVKPEGKMNIKRILRHSGMEYNFTFSGADEEYTYIRSVFEAFCILVKKDVNLSTITL